MPVPVFCFFVFQKSCFGNILGIGRNLDRTSYFSNTKTESRGETEEGHVAPTPWGRAGPPLPRRGVVWGPRGSAATALSPIYSSRREYPKDPSHYPRKVPETPPPSTLAREGSEALPGTLQERGIITEGLYITMPASGVMRE